jgi:hypothetical protein
MYVFQVLYCTEAASYGKTLTTPREAIMFSRHEEDGLL